MRQKRRSRWGLLATFAMVMTMAVPAALADDPDDGVDDGGHEALSGAGDLSEALAEMDSSGIVSTGPFADVTKNIDARGIGARDVPNATTDVWAHDGYAYTGTFNSPCGGDPDGGVWVWDVSNPNKVDFVTVIPSPTGSRSNDVRVAAMNSGDILVHSNEACGAGGIGGFEIYDVNDPANPVFLASVQTDDVNLFLQANFGFTDFGVHNLFLFTQGGNDYVAATVESLFGQFQIFDITDPTSPALVGFWGAEQSPNAILTFPALDGVDWVNTTDFAGVILPGNSYLGSGFGASQNRNLHDVTISADGTEAYLALWDEGLVLLDISDPTSPSHISTALDVANGSLDGEVNSHSVWPSEDGSIVVEGEEDFSAWEAAIPPGSLTLDGPATPGDPGIPATAIATDDGDDFEANQTGEFGTTDGTSVVVTSGNLAGNTYAAIELGTAAGSPTFGDIGPQTGELVWIGRACTLTGGDGILNAASIDPGDIAVARRGACEFDEKAQAADAAGAAALIIANNVSPSTPWSGLRIWDYSDPADPVLASTFDTVCSASAAPVSGCDPFGTYSVHNVQVETTGNKVKAYVSWYNDGMLILDVTDPYNPVEVGRYTEEGTDFWGVYKVTNSPFFYGSDRNGGLYVFKEQGAGSG